MYESLLGFFVDYDRRIEIESRPLKRHYIKKNTFGKVNIFKIIAFPKVFLLWTTWIFNLF